MRLATEFLASLPDFKLNEHRAAFDLTTATSKCHWLFLKPRQLLFFFQEPIHLATKWRNHLLLFTAQLRFAQQRISIEHIIDIMEDSNYSKLDHRLNRTNVNSKDRQFLFLCENIIT